jgi:hypothetical protein
MAAEYAELAKLREQVEELQAELAWRRELEAPPDAMVEAARSLGMRPWLVRVLHMFVVTPAVSHERLVLIADDMGWTTSEKFPNVAICHLRRALNPRSVHIENRYGWGYVVPADSHRRLKELMH